MKLALLAAVASLTTTGAATAQTKPDVVIASTPANVVQGFIPADVAPIAHVKPGQIVRIDTISHGGITDDPVATFGEAGIPPSGVLKDVVEIAKLRKGGSAEFRGHILTGPIHIDGAEPGDMLEVRILNVEPRVPYGTNSPGPGGAAPGLVAERLTKIIKFDMARKVALFAPGIEVPLGPFMGIMAVAPPAPDARVGSRAPGIFGGNLDFKSLKAGSTLYLPVNRTGALFVTGDSHAAQGDGEVDGNAIEASMTPTLQFMVHKGAGKAMTAPWVEDAENFYLLGIDPDLDVALKKSIEESVKFLQARFGLSAADAYSLCSIGVDYGIAEAVDQNLVVFGRISKAMFKTKTPYWKGK